jgi:hypothetical protein
MFKCHGVMLCHHIMSALLLEINKLEYVRIVLWYYFFYFGMEGWFILYYVI